MSFFLKNIFLVQLYFLRNNIFNPNDKILFDEAVKCISQKAYRAGFIMVWICAAESLRAKIVELAFKDSEAGRVLGEIKKCEQQNISPDKVILDRSEELGLLDKDEHKKLEHIRDMRNSYAHPTGIAPSLNELSTAFHQVCSYILNRPAQLKYGYVGNLINSMFFNRHFLDDDEIKITEFTIGIAHRLHPEVLPYLVKKICESYDVSSEDLIKRRAICFVSTLLKELKPNLKEESWAIIMILDQHPRVASLFLGHPEIWENLPQQAKDMCFGHLIEPTRKDGTVVNPSPHRIKRLKGLERAGCLSEKQLEKFNETLQKLPYESLISADMEIGDVIPRIISDLESHNWYAQNPAIDAIQNFGIKKISNLSRTEQEELGRNILQAAEGHSGSATNMVMVELKDLELPEAFVKGLLKECFTNEKYEFRLKVRLIKHILEIVTFHQNLKNIVNNVVEDITKSTPGFAFDENDIDSVVSIIDQFMPSLSKQKQKDTVSLRASLVNEKTRLRSLFQQMLTS